MTPRKTKLISALNIAINALEKGTVYYSWEKQECCNCGVVAQAILNRTPEELKRDYSTSRAVVERTIEQTKKDSGKPVNRNWQELVQFSCSVTGRPMTGIIQDLTNAGMGPEDIVHLEFMENEAILKRAKIDQKKKFKAKRVETKKLPHKNIFLRMFGVKKDKDVTTEYEAGYYENKNNLIKYLKAWVSILQEDPNNQELTLQEKLLNAVADENYEAAAKLRDEISAQA